jgi:hypothetical protein
VSIKPPSPKASNAPRAADEIRDPYRAIKRKRLGASVNNLFLVDEDQPVVIDEITVTKPDVLVYLQSFRRTR